MKNYAAEFPRLLFPDGITTTTDISAGTTDGILSAIVIAALTRDGYDVFLNHARTPSKKCLDMIEAFECCFDIGHG